MSKYGLIAILANLVACTDSGKDDTGDTANTGDADGDGFTTDDCDDNNADINPGATEVCDGADNDCDALVDDDDDSLDSTSLITFYADGDGDAFGVDEQTLAACALPEGFAAAGGDCNDSDDAIHPEANEVCDTLDNDCDDLIDGADDSIDLGTGVTVYADGDGDGYGDDATMQQVCEPLSGQVDVGGDCDDTSNRVYPGAAEVCDTLDNDCDKATGEAGTAAWLDSAGGWNDWTAMLTSTGTALNLNLEAEGTLYLCEGQWDLAIAANANVSIIGTEGPEVTTITSLGTAPVLSVLTNSITVNVEGVGMTGGAGTGSIFGRDYGAGVRCESDAELNLTDVDIFENSSGMSAGMMVYGCDVTLTSSTIRDNDADYAGGGVGLFGGSLTVEDAVVSGNTAGAYGFGGGLIAYTYTSSTLSTLDLIDSIVEDNSVSGGVGGGIYQEDATVTCTGTTGASNAGLFSNTDGVGGGALFSYGYDGTFTSTNCDYGTTAAKNDNSPSDIYQAGSTYNYGDDASFTCSSASCL